MTTYSLEGKTRELTISEKAALLVVSMIVGMSGVFAVSSGSRKNVVYQVRHDGHKAVSCNCAAMGRCSHMEAVNLHIAQMEAEEQARLATIAAEKARKEAERAAYLEFEFQCGAYSVPGLY